MPNRERKPDVYDLREYVVDGEAEESASCVEWRNGEGFDFDTDNPDLGSSTHVSISWVEWSLLQQAVKAMKKGNEDAEA